MQLALALTMGDSPMFAGGGKSMTFQLPPLAKKNCFTVVVCPLLALASDQVGILIYHLQTYIATVQLWV
jgi:hypothetical protein